MVLTQIFWIPNIARILRTRDVRGYSLTAWLLMTAGLACYLVYFAAGHDPVGVVANLSGVMGAGFTSVCIFRWRGNQPRADAVEVLPVSLAKGDEGKPSAGSAIMPTER